MNKILLSLVALLSVAVGAYADELVSGERYKIVTLDGTKALSCGATAQNNVKLTLTALNESEGGQIWKFHKNGDYWNITSSLGAFNIDNPSDNHAGFQNQACLWQSGNGDNQKWTFEAAQDGSYYMIPHENAQKCYAEDAEGLFTFQDKGADTRIKLVKQQAVTIDGITSGKYYRICSPDGNLALSNNSSTANDLVVSMTATNKSDEGQIWQMTYRAGYWQIKSYCGNVCLDNPSETHDKFNNQLIQWQTSGGNNQKWKFEKVGDNYYMIPFQNAANGDKCYGYNEDGVFIYQDKGGKNTQLRLVEATPPTCPVASLDGFYALQTVSTFPSYNYASEGKFVTFSSTGTCSLAIAYTFAGSRLYMSTDKDGHTTITLPQDDNAVVLQKNNKVNSSKTEAASKFTVFMNTDELDIDTRVALHIGDIVSTPMATNLNLVSANAKGNGLVVSDASLANSFCFRLVALPAAEDIVKLQEAISKAEAIEGLSDNAMALLQEAIAQAKSELNYPYITKEDVVLDIADLEKAINDARASNVGSSNSDPGEVTGITTTNTDAICIVAENHTIKVTNAKNVRIFNAAGMRQPYGTFLPSGTYVVKADNKVVKVVL